MSIIKVRAALETAALAVAPAIDTVMQSGVFTLASGTAHPGAYKPQADRPYQRLYLIPAAPDDREISANFIERGVFQVSLFYPGFKGPGLAEARAELIRSAFYKGRTLSSGGLQTSIANVPEIGQGMEDLDRWMVPVSIRYRDEITTS